MRFEECHLRVRYFVSFNRNMQIISFCTLYCAWCDDFQQIFVSFLSEIASKFHCKDLKINRNFQGRALFFRNKHTAKCITWFSELSFLLIAFQPLQLLIQLRRLFYGRGIKCANNQKFKIVKCRNQFFLVHILIPNC